jgi:lipid II:glycine glycyltransferase (peptidoglycan interpeptide bridge formation enzyme)
MDNPQPVATLEKSFRYLMSSGLGRILAATVEGERVAVSIFASFNGSAYFVLSAASAAGLKAQAPSLLLWEAMLRCAADGDSWFNLGGVSGDATDSDSPENGLYVSKMGFGPERVECVAGGKVLSPLAHRGEAVLRRLRNALGAAWHRG